MSRFIRIYDTTLRDGTQGEGVSFSMEDKVRLASSARNCVAWRRGSSFIETLLAATFRIFRATAGRQAKSPSCEPGLVPAQAPR